MRSILWGTALSLFVASAASAQAPSNPIRLEPYVGAFSDSYDISPDGERTGGQVGLRVGYDLGARTRLIADATYGETSNVSNYEFVQSYAVQDNLWVMTTVGAEYDLIPGTSSLSLGLRVGAGWRSNEITGFVGEPQNGEVRGRDGFSAMELVVPSLTFRQAITSWVGVALTLQDQMLDVLDGPPSHSPGVTLGISLR